MLAAPRNRLGGVAGALLTAALLVHASDAWAAAKAGRGEGSFYIPGVATCSLMPPALAAAFATRIDRAPGRGSSGMQRMLREYERLSGPGRDYCVLCHIPQAARGGEVPAWGQYSRDDLMNFRLFSQGGRRDDRLGRGSASLLCLTCHDGVIAPDSSGAGLGGYAGQRADTLARGHPMSVGFDAGRRFASRQVSGRRPAQHSGTRFTSDELLVAGKVECVSCHDVHQAEAPRYMLREQAAASELCLGCHPM